MNALLEKPDTVVPTDADTALAAAASRALASGRAVSPVRVLLDDGQEFALPQGARRLLASLLAEMAQGNAVTLVPVQAELTTQEAADHLNVSRPYLIRLLEEGKIGFHKVGTHRRIKFHDLLEYKSRCDAESDRAMDELAAQARDLGMGY